MAVELHAGMMVGRYRLSHRLASGGMGAVWAAVDERLDRDVAVKLLPRALVTDPSAERRFEREARAMGRLQHPNVVAVYDVGTADPGTGEELPYLVMELIPGTSLSALLEAGPLEARHAARIGLQVARALTAAHDAGVVHRDLKPSNVMVGMDGHVKVLDFGLARLMRSDGGSIEETLTVPGMVLGSCPYMAPEQAQGQDVSPASDLFSAGAVLYEAISGTRAFQGTTPMQVLQSVVRCRVRPLEEVAPEVPAPLAAVVDRCLQREPSRRYRSAGELAADLEAFLLHADASDHDVTAEWTSESVGAFSRRRRRDRWRWVAFAVCVAVVAAGLGAVVSRSGLEPVRPDPGSWSVRELVRSEGIISTPSWSPDGATLAFQRSTPGRSEVLGLDLGSGDRWRIAEASGTRTVTSPRFSPDGRAVLVKVMEGERHELQVLSAIGGEPVASLEDALHGAWLDGTRVVCSRQLGGDRPSLWVWRTDTGDVEEMPAPGPADRAWWAARPRPTGGLAALWGPSDARSGIRLVPERGAGADVVAPGALLRGVEWYPTGSSLVASLEGTLVRIDGDGSRALLPRTDRLWDPAPSPDGTRLAVTRREIVTDLVSVDPDGRGWSCLQCRVPESGWGSVAADGTVVYRRTVAGTSGLFLVEPGGVERRLTPSDEDASCPAFSPDGGRIAYLVRDGDTTRLEVIAREGGPPLVLAEGVEASEYPSWSPDGRFIAHAGGSPIRVRVVSAVGGVVVDLTPEGGDYPAWSPDGEWVAYSVWTDPSDPDQGAWIVSPETGETRKIGDEPTRLAWSPDGALVYQLRRRDDRLELWQAEVGEWRWRRRSVLDIGTPPRLHMEHLPFTLDPSDGELVMNRRSATSSLLVYEGLDPARW